MHFKDFKLVSTNPLSKLINLTNDDRQKQFIKALCKGCSKSDTVIYYLEYNEDVCGFIGISANRIDNIPCSHIDYLFVKKEFRNIVYEDLNNKKISEYLIALAISMSLRAKQTLGIRWLALNPDNDKLEDFYIKNFQFTKYKSKELKISYLFIAI